MSNSYSKHKLDFSRKVPDLVDNLDELIKIKYESSRRSISKAEDKVVQDHLANFGIKITVND
jgi:hypothetical protein